MTNCQSFDASLFLRELPYLYGILRIHSANIKSIILSSCRQQPFSQLTIRRISLEELPIQ